MSNEFSKIDIEKVWFYLDSLERDRLDVSGLTRKSGEVLALRQKLLSLPHHQYEAAMKTISKLVEEANIGKSQKEIEEDRRRKATLELFNRTTEMGTEKVKTVETVSRV